MQGSNRYWEALRLRSWVIGMLPLGFEAASEMQSTGLAAHSLLVLSSSQSFRSVTLSPLRVHMKAADVQNVFSL